MRSTKQIRQQSKLIATTEEVLEPFDCAQWDAEKAALAVPPADDAACDRACRNFATLRFWQANGEVTDAKTAELAQKLLSGLPNCITQCVSANNGTQTACFGAAKSVDELSACL
jgi:hypothetical protein